MSGLGNSNHARSRVSWRRRLILSGAAVAGTVALSGCGSPSILDAHGTKAADIAQLWWTLFAVAAAVTLIMLCLFAWAMFRPRPAGENRDEGLANGHMFVLVGGALIPAIILVAMFLVVMSTMVALSAPSTPAQLTVNVIGHRWWWEFDYNGQHFDTANEMHIPVGRAVRIHVTSADVIHSFWVPQLAEKLDAIPGKINTTWIEANNPGTYHGFCNVFCGIQHTNMQFIVVADPPNTFAKWLADQKSVPPQPKNTTLYQGQQVFLGSACVYCHTIRGTNASGHIGPDLTHFGSRKTIGAGIVPNTPGYLGGWIANSQSLKPGNAMPPMNLPGPQMQQVIAYLESLK